MTEQEAVRKAIEAARIAQFERERTRQERRSQMEEDCNREVRSKAAVNE